jgi:hypothetical protein
VGAEPVADLRESDEQPAVPTAAMTADNVSTTACVFTTPRAASGRFASGRPTVACDTSTRREAGVTARPPDSDHTTFGTTERASLRQIRLLGKSTLTPQYRISPLTNAAGGATKAAPVDRRC